MTGHDDKQSKFDVFISHVHDPDASLAQAVQHALFSIARPWLRRRALNVCLDETDFELTEDVKTKILKTLDETRLLLLLARPECHNSKWVRLELEHWLATKGTEGILLAVTGGEFDSESPGPNDAMPAWLRDRLPSKEPLYVDLRDESAFLASHPPGRVPIRRLVRNQAFRKKISRIAARAHGLDLSDLIGEDARQSKQRRWAVATVATAVLAMGALIGWNFPDARLGQEQRREIEVSGHIEDGYLQMASGNLSLARASFEAALDLDPDHRDAIGALISEALLAADNKRAKAICKAYEAVIRDEPVVARILSGEIVAAGMLGRMDGATVIDTIAGRWSSSPWGIQIQALYLMNVSAYFQQLGSRDESGYAKAYQLLTDAISASREPPAHLHFMRARAASMLRGNTQSLEFSIKAIERLFGDSPTAWLAIGDSLKEAGEPAMDAYSRALSLDDTRADIHNAVALALESQDPEKAHEHLERAVDLAPKNPLYLTNLAVSLAKQGRFDEAEANLLEAIELAPNFPGALRDLARLRQRQGDLAVAHSLLEKAVSIDLLYEEAWNDLGHVRMLQERYADAIPAFIEAARWGALALYDNNLGVAYQNTGDHGKAVSAFRVAIDRDDGTAAYHANLGRSYGALARDCDAERAFARAAALQPDNPEHAYNLSIAKQRCTAG